MPEDDLPPRVREFISQYLRSLEQLEILLLLWGKPDHHWTVQSVYDEVVSSKASVERWLDDFVALGFLEKTPNTPPQFRFTATGDLLVTIEGLAAAYKMKSVRVIEAIFKRGSDPARSFADAFKLRKQP